MGVFKCGGARFQRDCTARKNTGKQPSGTRANRASHGPRVRATVRVKKTKENPKEGPKESKLSGETRMAEQCARKSNENSESRCSTNW